MCHLCAACHRQGQNEQHSFCHGGLGYEIGDKPSLSFPKMLPKIYASLTQCMSPPVADLTLTDALNPASFSESWS